MNQQKQANPSELNTPTAPECPSGNLDHLLSRRQFLFGVSAGLVALSIPGWLQGRGLPARMQAQIAEYPRQVIGQVSQLTVNQPVLFNYPWEHPQALNFLVKLAEPAGGGVGPDNDIVAFNSFCSHQGGPLVGAVKGDIGVAGPCPLHWTTFDLTRHGMVISGHATLGLPQIVLETDGDDIVASGVLGLIFGYYDNSVDPNV